MDIESARSWIEVDAEALVANLRSFRTLMTGPSTLMAVVKSNAYGHDLPLVAKVLAGEADWFGVNSLEEAETLAQVGIDRPILIMGHTEDAACETVIRRGFRQVVFRSETARALSNYSVKLGQPARVHLKLETGTNRLGVRPESLSEFVAAINELPGLDVDGAYTHFANIEDTLDPTYATRQLAQFRKSLEIIAETGVAINIVHACATAGAVLYPESHFDMARIGIGTYGVWPSRETRIAARERGCDIVLQPALTWKSRLAVVKRVPQGESIGYGLTFQATRDMLVGVIPVGYYEGYDRLLSNRAQVLVRGERAPIVGRVAMNMMTVDVTDAHAEVGDEVVLLGRQAEDEISADALAELSGTIPYETLARIHPGLPRTMKG